MLKGASRNLNNRLPPCAVAGRASQENKAVVGGAVFITGSDGVSVRGCTFQGASAPRQHAHGQGAWRGASGSKGVEPALHKGGSLALACALTVCDRLAHAGAMSLPVRPAQHARFSEVSGVRQPFCRQPKPVLLARHKPPGAALHGATSWPPWQADVDKPPPARAALAPRLAGISQSGRGQPVC